MEVPNSRLVLFTKIIAIYSAFYVVLKIIAIAMDKHVIANLILATPLLTIGLAAFFSWFTQKYYWTLVVFATLIILIIRYFEVDWILAITDYYTHDTTTHIE